MGCYLLEERLRGDQQVQPELRFVGLFNDDPDLCDKLGVRARLTRGAVVSCD